MSVCNLYIASLEPNAGSLFVSMGIMELLKSRLSKIAFYKPIATPEDNDIRFMREHFGLNQSEQESFSYTLDELELLLSENRESEVIETIIEHYHRLESSCDFVIIQGFDLSSLSIIWSHNFNHTLAKNLQAPYICVVNGKSKTLEHLTNEIAIEQLTLKEHHVNLLSIIVNRLDPKKYDHFAFSKNEYHVPIFCIRELDGLNVLSVGEVKRSLKAELIFGTQRDLQRTIKKPNIAAMSVEHLIDHFEDGDLIIVQGDRLDVILSVMYANYSTNCPSFAGIVLTGGLVLPESFLNLLRGISNAYIAILSVPYDTYQTAILIEHIIPSFCPTHDRKIALAMGEFMRAVDGEKFMELLQTTYTGVVTPSMFEYALFQRAHRDRKRIVLPESNDERILRAADILLQRNAVDLILLGDPKNITNHAGTLGIDLSKATIIDPISSPKMETYVEQFYQMRRHKGVSLYTARDAMIHRTYFATMMVYNGDADGMVSGALHTTQDTILPALQIIKTRPPITLVSSLFFMCMPNQVLVYADCAINQDPNAEQLAQIAIASAKTAKQFGIEPKIAMLSYSTGDSGHGSDVDKVREATAIVKALAADLLIEGPIQYDAAIDPSVARLKLPKSDVAGCATIFIFPDLNTGNNTYKAVQRSSDAVAIGPILQGLQKPINDLSRGCNIIDIVNTVLITAIQAQGAKE
ncbi:phosphate acetyltransferase [Sulfuricurvum sp.]|uniref:phosphate acetyltransferase n=1 Tax=Sulfuricurvum sp. TaxID=2025608 RepID=UPI0019C92758|nr:phosphate acetyltransferase [Sulfuricurvum sp.]MBD3805651.1 phosphate acetyltransferase [Sulfuricurvum sp.]